MQCSKPSSSSSVLPKDVVGGGGVEGSTTASAASTTSSSRTVPFGNRATEFASSSNEDEGGKLNLVSSTKMVAKTESTESILAGNSYSEDAATTRENKIVIDDDIMIDSMQNKNDKDDHPSQPKSISTVVVSCNDKFHDWIDQLSS